MRKALFGLALVGALSGVASEAIAVPAVVVRFAGSDRYETAALISRDRFYPGHPYVFIASGESFSDALTAGASAAIGNYPLLLTRRDGVPPVTMEELSRLDPETILVAGGTSAVSDAVVAQLATLNRPVQRIAGADRYATAVAIAAHGFLFARPTAVIVSGEDFPDALIGGPLAAKVYGPMYLAKPDGLPAATVAGLLSFNVHSAYVVSTAGRLTGAVDAQLLALGIVPIRIEGATPAQTSVQVGRLFNGSEAFVTTSASYADGLAAGAPAWLMQSPILLVPGTCMPTEVADEIQHSGVNKMAILGGPAAVEAAVEQGTAC
jgi:putative cell wall-binding protein